MLCALCAPCRLARMHECMHDCPCSRLGGHASVLTPGPRPQVHGEHSLAQVVAVMKQERDTRSLVGLFGGDKKEAAAAAADGA